MTRTWPFPHAYVHSFLQPCEFRATLNSLAPSFRPTGWTSAPSIARSRPPQFYLLVDPSAGRKEIKERRKEGKKEEKWRKWEWKGERGGGRKGRKEEKLYHAQGSEPDRCRRRLPLRRRSPARPSFPLFGHSSEGRIGSCRSLFSPGSSSLRLGGQHPGSIASSGVLAPLQGAAGRVARKEVGGTGGSSRGRTSRSSTVTSFGQCDNPASPAPLPTGKPPPTSLLPHCWLPGVLGRRGTFHTLRESLAVQA